MGDQSSLYSSSSGSSNGSSFKKTAFVILRVDDEDKAIEILSEKGIDLLTADQIHGM